MVQQSRIENTILASLFFKEEYTRKVLPFIKEEYFGNRVEQLVFGEVFTTTQHPESFKLSLTNVKNGEDIHQLKGIPIGIISF